ncbi:5394_t:CDS:1, partial [Dentiscutata erythropus]
DNNTPLTPSSPNSSNKFYTNNDSEILPTKRPKVKDNDDNDDEITSSPTSLFSPNI